MIRIELPWPDAKLSPNAKRRSHWTKYHKTIASARKDAFFATVAALGPDRKAELVNGFLPMQIAFYPPDRRRRDDDGIIGSFKHARDGIADALGIDDRLFRPRYHIMPPEKPGKVIIEIGHD